MVIPAEISVMIRGTSYKVDISGIPKHILREALLHGLRTTLRNSGYGAANADHIKKQLADRMAKLKAGTWGDRTKG